MSKGLHRNQEFYQKGHDDLGRGLRRAGLKIPGSDAPSWNTDSTGKTKPTTKYMNKGGSVKKRKGYGHGGMVDTPKVNVMPDKPVTVPRLTKTGLEQIGYKGGGMVSGAYKRARKKEPKGRLTDRDVSGGMVSGAYKRARKKEPTGRLTDRDVRRAGLK
jgi:hypothetical protein